MSDEARYEQRPFERLSEIEHEIHDLNVLRDACLVWAHDHQERIARLVDERDLLRAEIAF